MSGLTSITGTTRKVIHTVRTRIAEISLSSSRGVAG